MSKEQDGFEELEGLLREELRPRSAPDGFTERMMARQVRAMHARRLTAMRWAIAAVLLLGILSGAYWKRAHDENLAGARARNQVLLALRITAATLNDVQHKVLKENRGEAE